ncbi:hypothetical protein [Thalassospira sp. SN3W]|uniref:cytidylyltransferase domain-containing protein n=1 Tax=Thalassospira sp. SN3W TaxID=3035476 RepID=UPI00311AD073
MIIIPAKYSSSRAPQKNFRPFYNGLSLLQISVIRSVTADIGPVLVSTENIDFAREQINPLPAAVKKSVSLHKRPLSLAHDPATILDVLVDCLLTSNTNLPNYISVVLPTSPFNSVSSIQNAHEKFISTANAEKLISVSPSSKPPYNAWVDAPSTDPDRLEHAFPDSPYALRQSTSCPMTYFSNGCISIYSVAPLLTDKQFNSTIGYKMPILSGIDIDFEHEFDTARLLFPDWSEDLNLFTS